MSRVLGGAGISERTQPGEEVQVERGPLGPVQFWRGQSRYVVGELLDSWVETAPWWQQHAMASGMASGAAAPGAASGVGATAELVATREVWRVEAVRAGRSRMSFAGVYDLSWDATGNRWWLVRVHD
jgi:hypothetical protein